MQRSQELLSALGLIRPLNEIGGQMRRLMVHAYGKCFGPRTMRLNESPFHDVILCGQHNFEKVVASGLETLGVDVEFDTELTQLSQDSSGVIATLRRHGEIERARFDYVVGCDGATGITRTFTKHNFTPDKTGVGIRQIDAKLR
jgi:2-polyprenyl-6-methoxyphenol hydroxylase-like FAD-dependent oxidoreductase